MKMTQEMLEIMMGKYLDGEIAPRERHLLEAELDRDPQAKELLAQLREMHERCGEVVASEILDKGKSPGEVFEQAWRRQSKLPLRLTMKMRGHARFAAGLAAGLVMGLTLHFVLPVVSTPGGGPAEPDVVVRDTQREVNAERQMFPGLAADPADEMILNVDWYNFTDKRGNKWLVEGLREDAVRPAAYYGDL